MKRFPKFPVLSLAATLLLTAADCHADPVPAPAATPFVAVVTPENALAFRFVKDGAWFGSLDMLGWGPNWSYAPPSKAAYAEGSVLSVTTPFLSDPAITLSERVRQAGPDALAFTYILATEKDRALTQLSSTFSFAGAYDAGTVDVTAADGKPVDPLPLPTTMSGYNAPLSKVVFHVKGIGDVQATFDPPVSPHVENGALRMRLAHDTLPAGTHTETMTLTFPGPVRLAASKDEVAAYSKTLPDTNWFEWKPANDVGPSVIGLEPWLDGPAGKHGGVRIAGDHFAFSDGTPVKFWGTNLAYTQNTPDKAQADLTAARFAKYGVNCVRMHKFTNPGEGIGTDTSTLAFDPAALDKLDYFTAQLKKRGVYYGWSHSYHYKVRPGDKPSLLAYDEIASNLGGDTYGLINGAPDIQDRMIAMVVALLGHKNPYTGLTYAQEPALAFLEVQNEDDIFFYTFSAIDKCPTYKQKMRERFGAWLLAHYGTQAGLAKAWGAALNAGETAGGSVDIQTNPWFFGDDGLAQQKANAGARQRLLDNAAFFHHEQNAFYGRFVKAVRAAGYRGPINGSPWQAPTSLPHYLNLKSDAMLGYVDRHNYFGGDGLADTMLSDPGSGYLGTGLQQVAGHPFTLSEWCHVYPETLSAEGPAIMAAYALGLQGWNASYEFQSSSTAGGFRADAGHGPWDVWNADVPNQIGQFPALARMIYRGDVKEGAPISVRRVSDSQLASGTFDFSDKIVQAGDVKQFGGTVPPESLAAGRVLVQFTDRPTPSTLADLSRYGAARKRIASNTGQLTWDYSGKGYFTVQTPGTLGVVGFAPTVPVRSGGISLTLGSPYASAFVTALDKASTLATCKRALVTLAARESNTGFTYFTIDNHVLDNGHGPIMVEGVQATLTVAGRPVQAVNVLDQDGRGQPGRTVPAGPGAALRPGHVP